MPLPMHGQNVGGERDVMQTGGIEHGGDHVAECTQVRQTAGDERYQQLEGGHDGCW